MTSALTLWRLLAEGQTSEALALEANVVRAGMALACPYSTSDEYEAEILKERREAGAYDAGPPAQRVIVIMAVIAAIAVALFMIIAA